jgi:hypothetical protein
MEAHFVEESIDAETGEKRLDGWPIGTRWRFPQPKSLEQRLEHARMFRERFSFPAAIEFVVDTIDNSFNRQYAAWPDSAYMMRKGALHYRSLLEEGGFRSSVFTKHINALLEE